MEFKPRTLMLVLLVFGVLLAGIFRFGAAERAQQGPSLLRVDQQGDLYVVFNEKIFRLSANGVHKRTYALRDLGVDELIGGMAFFRNGDLMLRTGESVPNWYEQILIQFRIRQPNHPTGAPGDRLARCNLSSLKCAPLKGFEQTFNRTFRIDIDAADNVYIADTGREALYRLHPDGQMNAAVRSGFRLPNQLMRDGERIVVTNTNRNELTFIPITDAGFGAEEKWGHVKVNVPEAQETGEFWPMDLLKVGADWLVLSQGPNMMFGDVFRFAEDGSYQNRFDLSPEVDPVALARLGNDVIVADYAGLRLLRFSEHGEPRGELIVPEIGRYAAEVRAAQVRYSRYQLSLWIAFAAALVIGFAVAIAGDLKRRRDQSVSQAAGVENAESPFGPDSVRPDPDDPDIHWMGVSKKFKRLNTLLAAALIILSLLLVLVFMLLIAVVQDSPQGEAMRLVLYGLLLLFEVPILVLVMAIYSAIKNIRVGVLREWIMLRDVSKRAATGRASEIGVTQDSIIIDDVLLKYRTPVLSIFDKQAWTEWVEPRLFRARTVKGADLLIWYWNHRQMLVICGLLLFLLALALAFNIDAIIDATTDYVKSFANGSLSSPG